MREYNMIHLAQIFHIRHDNILNLWVKKNKILNAYHEGRNTPWHVTKTELRRFMRENAKLGSTKKLCQQ